jgi:di/tricarboxylate transporter
VVTLVLGWLQNPSASLNQLAQISGRLGVEISAAGIHQRIGMAAVAVLQSLVRYSLGLLVSPYRLSGTVLSQFNGVVVVDSTVISLPAHLAQLWAGVGAVAMVLTGCLNMEEFYDAIEWKVIFLIAGMLPLSIAMIDTGLAEQLGLNIVNYFSGYPPMMGIVGMFILTVLITQILGGQVTALMIGPIAISTAVQMNVSPQAMSVAVAIACSTAFLTPIAHPVNILMMGPGGYQFKDFVKVGLGMSIVTLLTLIIGLMIFWQIH